MSTPTPRTDEAQFIQHDMTEVVSADFARTLEAELADERAIVSRIWVQLGSPTYEQLKGRSIYDLIDEMKAERARLDWLTMNAHVEPEEYRGGSFSEGGTLWHSWRFSSPRHAGDHASAAIDAAMKEETK